MLSTPSQASLLPPQAAAPEPADQDLRRGVLHHRHPASALHHQVRLREVRLCAGALRAGWFLALREVCIYLGNFCIVYGIFVFIYGNFVFCR